MSRSRAAFTSLLFAAGGVATAAGPVETELGFAPQPSFAGEPDFAAGPDFTAGVVQADATGDLALRLTLVEAELASLTGDPGCAPDGCGAVDCGRASLGCRGPAATGVYGGAEVVFARPMPKESFRANIVSVTGTQTLLPTDYDYTATPRAWVGYVGEGGVGVRGRYWQLDEGSGERTYVADGLNFPGTQAVTLIFPGAISTDFPGESLQVSDSIRLETIDLEGTLHFQAWGGSFVASGGLQYGRIEQDYRAAVISGGVPEQVLNWDRSLEGVGPKIGLEMRRPIGSWGFEVFASPHIALLFAEKNISRFTAGGPPTPPFPALPALTYEGAEELLLTGLVQLGVQWSRELSIGGDLFVRGTYEGQVWTDAGGSALGYLGVEGFGVAVGLAK